MDQTLHHSDVIMSGLALHSLLNLWGPVPIKVDLDSEMESPGTHHSTIRYSTVTIDLRALRPPSLKISTHHRMKHGIHRV